MDINNVLGNIKKEFIWSYREIQYKFVKSKVYINESIAFVRGSGIYNREINEEDIARNKMFIDAKLIRVDDVLSRKSRNWNEYLEKVEEVTTILCRVKLLHEIERVYYEKLKNNRAQALFFRLYK